ncbi:hypothetical protein PoB_007649800 [Plakobranchus ocellatus]|uniref:Uncharacterized protein n=1 Tax=Plakobranchus ocellatus TaxID=259542 RepID=A0AAV4E077_9GAST|nr:hypothetical protein PoB_007649800 [Plakobranchus ocellatus]
MANYLIKPYAKNNQDPTPGSPMLGQSVEPTLLTLFNLHLMLCAKNGSVTPDLQLLIKFPVEALRWQTIAGTFSVNILGASAQQGDLRLSSPPSGQGAGGGARTCNRKVPSDLRADSLPTVQWTPPFAFSA